MDVIGQTFGYVVEFFLDTHKKTSTAKITCTRKNVLRYFFVFFIISGIIAYTISVSIRCVSSYETPAYQDKVASEVTLEFPILYVCSKEMKSSDGKSNIDSLVHDGMCTIDDDWNFDPSSLVGKNVTKCSVGEVDVPPLEKLGRNWSCAVFNMQGHLNATRDKKQMESMHVAFTGSFTKPLTAILMDKHSKRALEPSFIFSSHTDVYVLMRKIESTVPGYDFIGAQKKGKTKYVSYLPTISSSVRFDPTGKRDKFTHLSLSFSSFDVTTMEQAVTFSWLDALAAIGGATCAARIFLLILPDPDTEVRKESNTSLVSKDRIDNNEEEEEDEERASSSSSSSLHSPLLIPRKNKTFE